MRSLADGVKTYDQVVEVGPNSIVLPVSESFAPRSFLHRFPMEEG